MNTERRTLFCDLANAQVETREDGPARVSGYAAVFHRAEDAGTEFRIADDYVERIAPGAFSDALTCDVRALFNHDQNNVLGRTVSETLTLSEDTQGLRYEVDMPDTQLGRDLVVSIARGDVTGSSFSFTVDRDGAEVREEGGQLVRTITKVKRLYDVGPVTFPAYEGASTSVRSDDDAADALAEREAFEASKKTDEPKTPPPANELDLIDTTLDDMRMTMG